MAQKSGPSCELNNTTPQTGISGVNANAAAMWSWPFDNDRNSLDNSECPTDSCFEYITFPGPMTQRLRRRCEPNQPKVQEWMQIPSTSLNKDDYAQRTNFAGASSPEIRTTACSHALPLSHAWHENLVLGANRMMPKLGQRVPESNADTSTGMRRV
jgi:hypothetical protein